MLPAREADDLSEKLLVDLSENIGRKNRELVRAVGVIQVPNNLLQRRVVDFERERQLVRGLWPVALFVKMKEARVVPVVRLLEELAESGIDPCTIQEHLQSAGRFDSPIFADSQEDDPIDRSLNGEIQFALRKVVA